MLLRDFDPFYITIESDSDASKFTPGYQCAAHADYSRACNARYQAIMDDKPVTVIMVYDMVAKQNRRKMLGGIA